MQRPWGDVMKYVPCRECRLLTIKYPIFIWFYWVKSQEWISALDQLRMWNVKIRAHQFLASLWVSAGMCLITVISPNTSVWPPFRLKTQQRPESPARLACFWCCKLTWRANRFPPIKGALTDPERRGRFIKGEAPGCPQLNFSDDFLPTKSSHWKLANPLAGLFDDQKGDMRYGKSSSQL